MKKITKLQKEIFDRHLQAYLNDFKGSNLALVPDHLNAEETRVFIKQSLLAGKIVPGMWSMIFTEQVSMTSQLYKSMFDHLTDKAIQDCRNGWKYYLNYLNIK